MVQSSVRTREGSLETAACAIERLPEELLAAVISLTSPPDACRAAAVSRTFRPAADSDAVWSRFLPRDLPQFADGELPFKPPSKKALFRCLSDQPSLLPCKLVQKEPELATFELKSAAKAT
ncbi:F-box protein PP2-B11-like [Lolium rigidum]|uniref:F-box protein PP2-B11-like n=1 Tax=Lolium rigidum TaxID=89674 RepID=UPI001F5C0B70|nr:F-box protein PP2-B11-like [Lolium rigidum]